MNGTALDDGAGYVVYESHSYVYASGGQGVLIGDGGERDMLYHHYCKSLHLEVRRKPGLLIITQSEPRRQLCRRNNIGLGLHQVCKWLGQESRLSCTQRRFKIVIQS